MFDYYFRVFGVTDEKRQKIIEHTVGSILLSMVMFFIIFITFMFLFGTWTIKGGSLAIVVMVFVITRESLKESENG